MALPHGEACPDCGHPFDPHCFIPTRETPEQGGIVLCPVEDCQCLRTYSLEGHSTEADVLVPPEGEVNLLRAMFQAQSRE